MYAVFQDWKAVHVSRGYPFPVVEELPDIENDWGLPPRVVPITDGPSTPPALTREFGSRKSESRSVIFKNSRTHGNSMLKTRALTLTEL